MTEGKIFISYRRDDSAYAAGRLFDRLSARFDEENIFMDVEGLEPGVDFHEALSNAVSACDVLIALIGKQWLDIIDEKGHRRLDNPEDFVRIEIATALERNIRVIPVLVQGARMPISNDLPTVLHHLARLNYLDIRHERFNADADRLARAIEKYFGEIKIDKSREIIQHHLHNEVPEVEKENIQEQLSTLHTEALAAFYTRKWDEAISLFNQIITYQKDYKDVSSKLEEAKYKQKLEIGYKEGIKAYSAQAWEEAIEHLDVVVALDASYQDASKKLKDARHQKKLADLYTEAHQLHQVQKWQAVINIFKRIEALDASYPDPDQLLVSARSSLDAMEREQKMAFMYRRGLQYMDAMEWADAIEQFEAVQQLVPDYQETDELLERARQEIENGIKHPSLALELSTLKETVEVGETVTWKIACHNDGDDDLRQVRLNHGRTLLREPFDLAVGGQQEYSFDTKYRGKGQKTIAVVASAIASDDVILRENARATVQVEKIRSVAPKTTEKKTISERLKTIPRGLRYLGGGISIALVILLIFVGGNALFGTLSNTDTQQPLEIKQATIATNTLQPIPETAIQTAGPAAQTAAWAAVSTVLALRAQDVSMVLVPKGSFAMGSEEIDNANPVHTVMLDDFYIDQYEVTNQQFTAFLNDLGNQEEGGTKWLADEYDDVLIVQSDSEWKPKNGYADHPAVVVSWYGAQAYCTWRGARLPTEAEWEKAARGGLDGKLYPWGNDFPICKMEAENGAKFNDGVRCNDEETAPVGSYSANGYGLYDMAGNVWEWIADWFDKEYYAISPQSNPTGPENGSFVVMRGGSYSNEGEFLQVTLRGGINPILRSANIGFRCARSP